MTALNGPTATAAPGSELKLYFFSDLLNRRVSETRADFKIGKVTDLVFRLAEPFPDAVGIYISHGWGNPSEFITWDRVVRIEGGTIFVQPPETGERYPPFVDQPGWLLLNEHLMGRTILDIDGRQTEVVNDVQLLQSRGRMVIAHVDVSFNGFLRKWGVGWLRFQKDRLISWRYVQPFSVEDATASDKVALALTRTQIHDLPSEDLADALEEISGLEQEAMFSVLEAEKAAETLLETEPRAQRQIVADLHPDRARAILEEMSAAQAADLLSALPWDDRLDLMQLMPEDKATRVHAILASDETKAGSLMSAVFVALPKHTTVADALMSLRNSGRDKEEITYIYVVDGLSTVLLGAVDIRDLVLATEDTTLEEIMGSPAVSADTDLHIDDVVALFAKYQFRLLPVTDAADHLVGVVSYKDIMR